MELVIFHRMSFRSVSLVGELLGKSVLARSVYMSIKKGAKSNGFKAFGSIEERGGDGRWKRAGVMGPWPPLLV